MLIMLVILFLWSHGNCGCNSRGLMLSVLVPFTSLVNWYNHLPHRDAL